MGFVAIVFAPSFDVAGSPKPPNDHFAMALS
jgi:hypothetical protein